MTNIIDFPFETRVEQILRETIEQTFDQSILQMHLDVLNDLILEEICQYDAQRAINNYCDQHDLDPDGYDLHWAQQHEEVFVQIAE
jgi:hypothetical protein